MNLQAGEISVNPAVSVVQVLSALAKRCKEDRDICQKSFVFYACLHHILFLPLAFLTFSAAIISFLVASQIFNNETRTILSIVVGALSIVTGTGQALLNYLKIVAKRDAFAQSALDYDELMTKLENTCVLVNVDLVKLVKAVEDKVLEIKSRLKSYPPLFLLRRKLKSNSTTNFFQLQATV